MGLFKENGLPRYVTEAADELKKQAEDGIFTQRMLQKNRLIMSRRNGITLDGKPIVKVGNEWKTKN